VVWPEGLALMSDIVSKYVIHFYRFGLYFVERMKPNTATRYAMISTVTGTPNTCRAQKKTSADTLSYRNGYLDAPSRF